jgi:LmbE family N-acetylglucosaminyl deacetylase
MWSLQGARVLISKNWVYALRVRTFTAVLMRACPFSLRLCMHFVASLTLVGCSVQPIRHTSHFTSIYIAPHPDDIELFMGMNAWHDTVSGTVVFIVLTAGDAGYATGFANNGDPLPYYRAREQGHERAVRLWVGLNGGSVPATEKSTISLARGRYTLDRLSIGGAVRIYFLRLPDGRPDGAGYPGDANESLKKLLTGQIASITSIDHTLSFSLRDLETALGDIIAAESAGSAEVWINIQDESWLKSPIDHSDHKATANIVLDTLNQARFSCVNIARYATYVNSIRPRNLSTSDTDIHLGTWGAVNSGITDGGPANTWDFSHLSWIGKEYYRKQLSRTPCLF